MGLHRPRSRLVRLCHPDNGVSRTASGRVSLENSIGSEYDDLVILSWLSRKFRFTSNVLYNSLLFSIKYGTFLTGCTIIGNYTLNFVITTVFGKVRARSVEFGIWSLWPIASDYCRTDPKLEIARALEVVRVSSSRFVRTFKFEFSGISDCLHNPWSDPCSV